MASFIAQRRVIQLLELHGLMGTRILQIAPRVVEIPDLDAALRFWSTTLKLETIDKHPEILFIKPSVHTETFNRLTKVFSNKDIPILLNNMPRLLLEDWSEVEEKIDFAITEIQAKHKEIVYSYYLTYSMEHIRTRFNFLWRSGVYLKPHKRDRKRGYVLPLKVMVESDHSEILKMTGLLAEEYSAMQKITAQEIMEEKKQRLKMKEMKEKFKNRNYRPSRRDQEDEDFDSDTEEMEESR